MKTILFSSWGCGFSLQSNLKTDDFFTDSLAPSFYFLLKRKMLR